MLAKLATVMHHNIFCAEYAINQCPVLLDVGQLQSHCSNHRIYVIPLLAPLLDGWLLDAVHTANKGVKIFVVIYPAIFYHTQVHAVESALVSRRLIVGTLEALACLQLIAQVTVGCQFVSYDVVRALVVLEVVFVEISQC